MSVALFVSPGTRLVASDANATYRPSALIEGVSFTSLLCTPEPLTLTSESAPAEAEARVRPRATAKLNRLFVKDGDEGLPNRVKRMLRSTISTDPLRLISARRSWVLP